MAATTDHVVLSQSRGGNISFRSSPGHLASLLCSPPLIRCIHFPTAQNLKYVPPPYCILFFNALLLCDLEEFQTHCSLWSVSYSDGWGMDRFLNHFKHEVSIWTILLHWTGVIIIVCLPSITFVVYKLGRSTQIMFAKTYHCMSILFVCVGEGWNNRLVLTRLDSNVDTLATSADFSDSHIFVEGMYVVMTVLHH
jgi:hypothetical protein